MAAPSHKRLCTTHSTRTKRNALEIVGFHFVHDQAKRGPRTGHATVHQRPLTDTRVGGWPSGGRSNAHECGWLATKTRSDAQVAIKRCAPLPATEASMHSCSDSVPSDDSLPSGHAAAQHSTLSRVRTPSGHACAVLDERMEGALSLRTKAATAHLSTRSRCSGSGLPCTSCSRRPCRSSMPRSPCLRRRPA
jgi:hypothetical protein